ncbi:hypothetical protein CYMTET_51432, partial [Cymbomonas tetramitiformis]
MIGQSVIVPLQLSTSLAINPFWAWYWNRETCYFFPDVVGSGLIVLGSIIICLAAEDDTKDYSWSQLNEELKNRTSVIGFFISISLVGLLYCLIWLTSTGSANAFGAKLFIFPDIHQKESHLTLLCYPILVAAVQSIACTFTVALSFVLWGVVNDDSDHVEPGNLGVYGLISAFFVFTALQFHVTTVAMERVPVLLYYPLYSVTFQ